MKKNPMLRNRDAENVRSKARTSLRNLYQPSLIKLRMRSKVTRKMAKKETKRTRNQRRMTMTKKKNLQERSAWFITTFGTSSNRSTLSSKFCKFYHRIFNDDHMAYMHLKM